MDQYTLADQYINQIREDFRPHMVQGTGVLSLALIRACEDLAKVIKGFEEYKAAIVREKKEDLAKILGVHTSVLDSVLQDEAIKRNVLLTKPQDRSGAERPPVSPDPLAGLRPQQDGPVSRAPDGDPLSTHSWPRPPRLRLDSEEPKSELHCPNCGELADFIQSGTGESPKLRIFCPECDYEETR